MVVVALRMWRQAKATMELVLPSGDDAGGPACRRDAAGTLMLTSRCAMLLLVVGLLTGVLSGLFGVGGGFVIVPALILFSQMTIHRAIGTSLLVVALVSVSGVTAHLWAGREIPLDLTGGFIVGGLIGLVAGQSIGRRLSGPVLQRVFSAAILLVAAYVLIRNVLL
jgi:uncharacterized membrane protein YfcA